MGDHIYNKLTIIGNPREVNKVFELIKTVNQDGTIDYFDLNKVIPQPKAVLVPYGIEDDEFKIKLYGIDKQWGGTHQETISIYESLSKELREEADAFWDSYLLLKNTFNNHIYPAWHYENWGSPWVNAQDPPQDGVLEFISKNSPPNKCIKMLSKMFSDLRFEFEYHFGSQDERTFHKDYQNGEYAQDEN